MSVEVFPTREVELRATADLRIVVPAGAGGGQTATLTYSPDVSRTGELQNGVDLRSFADVHLSSGQPRTPLIFTWTFDDPLPAGWDGSFFTGDPEVDGLRRIPTTISADRRTAVATVSSLSPKSFGAWLQDDVSRFVGQVLSKRGDRPTCAGAVPEWVMSTAFVDQMGGDNPVLACMGRDPSDASVLVVKVTNNRGHGLVLDVPADWRWMYLSNSAGVGDLSQELYAHLRTQGRRQVLLAPGQQLHLGFTREQIEQGGDPFVIDGSVSLEAVVFGLAVSAIEEVLGDKAAGSGVLAALMIAKCLPNAWDDDISSVGDLASSVTENLSCFTNVNAWVRLGIDTFGEDRFFDAIPISDAIKKRNLVKKISNRLMIFTVAQNLLDLGQSMALQLWSPSAFDLQVIAKVRQTPSPQTSGPWRSLANGQLHSCGVKADDSGWCWGDNHYGEVGDGTTIDRSRPTRVLGRWRDITAGGWQTCGVWVDDSAWCWGANSHGQLGNGTTTDEQNPTRVPGSWRGVSAGIFHSCGIKTDGSGWCWGYNALGQLGDGTLISRLAPTQVPGDWTSISVGLHHTCGLTSGGTAKCWGSGGGAVGDGTTIQRPVPVTLPGAWTSISAGYGWSCGLRPDRTAWCWGDNTYGQVGDGTTVNRLRPTQVPGNWSSVNAGHGLHSCGTTSDGTGWCWGDNSYGQLGDGSRSSRLGPVAVPGRWDILLANSEHSCGLETGGSAWCWGDNAQGQLGDGTTTSKWIPTLVDP